MLHRAAIFAGRALPAALPPEDAAPFLEARAEIFDPLKFLVPRLIGFYFASEETVWKRQIPSGCLFEENFCVDWASALPSSLDFLQIGQILLPFSAWRFPAVALFQSVSLVFYFIMFLVMLEVLVLWALRYDSRGTAALLHGISRVLGWASSPIVLLPFYFSAFAVHPGSETCVLLMHRISAGNFSILLIGLFYFFRNPQSFELRNLQTRVNFEKLEKINFQVANLWAENPEKIPSLSLHAFLAVSSILRRTGSCLKH